MFEEIRRTTVHTEYAGELGLTYYLFDTLVEMEGARIRRYGIRVETSRGEAAAVADISGNRGEVMALLDRLCTGTVTPVTLRDVVSDWLYEREMA